MGLTEPERQRLLKSARDPEPLGAVLDALGDRVSEADRLDAARRAITWGSTTSLKALFARGLAIHHAAALLTGVTSARMTQFLQHYVALAAAVDALGRGNDEPAMELLGTLFAARPAHQDKVLLTGIDQTRSVRELLRSGLDPGATVNGAPLIFHLLELGLDDALQDLLAAGADPNAPSPEGWLPLQVVRFGSSARVLMAYGADPRRRGIAGRSCLYRRWWSPATVDAVEVMAAHCTPAEIRAGVTLPPVQGIHDPQHHLVGGRMHESGEFDRPEIPRLIGLGAEWTLDWACALGRLDGVHRLLEAGANANGWNAFGFGPLQLAVGWTTPSPDRDAIVQLLLEHGADPNHYSPTALTPASGRSGPLAPPPIQPPADRPSPLALALRRRAFDIAHALLRAGAVVEHGAAMSVSSMPTDLALALFDRVTDPGVRGALALRAGLGAQFTVLRRQCSDRRRLQSWMETCIDIDEAAEFDRLLEQVTPEPRWRHDLLWRALERPQTGCLGVLLRRWPSLATATSEAGTPALHAAVRRRHRGAVTLLLTAGADPQAMDAQRQTAFDLRPLRATHPWDAVDAEWPAWLREEAERIRRLRPHWSQRGR